MIDGNEIVGIIASSTSSYMVEFSPVFLLIGGIILAIIVLVILVSILRGRNASMDFDSMDFDDTI